MLRANSTSTIYLLNGNRMPDNPIAKLKLQFPEENYISGFLLVDAKYQELVLQLVDEWKQYDQSFNGLWHHPHFQEVFEERISQSNYFFSEIDWIVAGIKGDATDLIEPYLVFSNDENHRTHVFIDIPSSRTLREKEFIKEMESHTIIYETSIESKENSLEIETLIQKSSYSLFVLGNNDTSRMFHSFLAKAHHIPYKYILLTADESLVHAIPEKERDNICNFYDEKDRNDLIDVLNAHKCVKQELKNENNNLIMQGLTEQYNSEAKGSSDKKDDVSAVPKIFISYKRVNKEKVFEIKNRIEQSIGEKCWIDLDGIESDAQFVNVIIGAINKADVFLFMYSSAHLEITDYENDWTVREINFAKEKKKRIVWVNLDSSEKSDWFVMMFPQKQEVDANSDFAMNRLFDDLRNWIDSPTMDIHHHNINDARKESKNDNTSDFFDDSIELQLAWIDYENGNYNEALKQFLLIAKTGSANALNAIGIYYYEGKACKHNYQQALSYFQKAANMGYASAMRNLGDCYRLGHGVAVDMEVALCWYKKAAAKNNLKAIYLLAQSLGPDNPAKFANYQKAASMGSEDAKEYVHKANDLYKEGMMDLYYPGCESEQKRAYCLIRKAANMGLPEAQKMIADETKFDFDTESVWRSYLSSIENMKRKAEETSSREDH